MTKSEALTSDFVYSLAFSSLKRIYLPSSIQYIADDAFEGSNVIGWGEDGTYASSFFKDNNMSFESYNGSIILWYSVSGASADALLEIVSRYNNSQNRVFVDAQYQGEYGDLIEKLKDSQIGQFPCDIFHGRDIDTRFILDSGWIIPLQHFIDKDGWNISTLETNLLAYYTENGCIKAFPLNCSMPVMYYNATAFEEAGITDIPNTVDGLLEIAARLSLDINGTHGNETGFDVNSIERYGLSFSNYGWFFEQWVSKMNRDYVNNYNGHAGHYATRALFGDNGAALEVFSMWKKISECPYANCIETGGTSIARNAFISGKTAIILGSTANMSNILYRVSDNFKVGVAFFPCVNTDDGGNVYTGGGALWMVDSGNPDRMNASYDFIRYLAKAESQSYWSATTGYLPINVNAKEYNPLKSTLEKHPQYQTAIDQSHVSGSGANAPYLSVFETLRQYVEEITSEVYLGQLTPEQGAQQLNNRSNSAISQYNMLYY